MSTKVSENEHIPFDELSAFVFAKNTSKDFLSVAARINKHLMACPSCKKNYYALMNVKDEIEKAARYETFDERIETRVFAFLYSKKHSSSLQAIVKESLRFKKWVSFNIRSMKEIVSVQQPRLAHPVLASVMKSSTSGSQADEVKTEIKTSLYDRNRNRVSIGLDGTLSLYFDASSHPAGKRVIILPDDATKSPQMVELTRYDDSVAYVRVEGIAPGEYTVVIEE